MHRTIQPLLLCAALSFSAPAPATEISGQCPTAAASRIDIDAASCPPSRSALKTDYPFSSFLQDATDSDLSLGLAAIMVGLLAVRVYMR